MLSGGRIFSSPWFPARRSGRSEEHTSELQSLRHVVYRLLLEKKRHRPGAGRSQGSLGQCQGSCPVRPPGPRAGNRARRSRKDDLNRPEFFFNDTATTEIYTLSLHDALPI